MNQHDKEAVGMGGGGGGEGGGLLWDNYWDAWDIWLCGKAYRLWAGPAAADDQIRMTRFGTQSKPRFPARFSPANVSAMIGCATEWELLISAHLSSDAVSSLRKVWVLKESINRKIIFIVLWKQHGIEART